MCKILAVVVAFFLWALANSTFLGRDSLPLVLIYIIYIYIYIYIYPKQKYLGCKKGEANQKQQVSDYNHSHTCD